MPETTALTVGSFVLLGVTILSSFALVAFLVMRSQIMVEKLFNHVMMLKGLHPHHVAPETWMPGGMSHPVYQEMKTHTVPAEEPKEPVVSDVGSDARAYHEEQKQDAVEFMAALRATTNQKQGHTERQPGAHSEFEAALSQAAQENEIARAMADSQGPRKVE